MRKILLIDACFRKDSRTKEITDYLLSKLDGEVTRLDLSKLNFSPLSEKEYDIRVKALENNQPDHPLFKEANLYKEADIIVFSTPFYDCSFSSLIKIFIEHICINGIPFKFTEKGEYVKLCKAQEIYYVTTSGGKLLTQYGYEYIKYLNETFFGIKNTHLIKAEFLDIVGCDINAKIDQAKKDVDLLLK